MAKFEVRDPFKKGGSMKTKPIWYSQSLYEQAWENYRNEDENYRSTITQYLVFVASLLYTASQARPSTIIIGWLGLIISGLTIFYLGRIVRYSRRWLVAKGAAIGKDLDDKELEHLKIAGKMRWFPLRISSFPGYYLNLTIPAVGALIFLILIYKGHQFWGA